MLRTIDVADVELESVVDAFEAAHAADRQPAIEDFAPDASHPNYAGIVGELMRIDLELGWRRGRGPSLDDYRRRFAAVLSDVRWLSGLALEEYRMRCEAGEPVTPGEYRDRYGIDVSAWPTPASPGERTTASRRTRTGGSDAPVDVPAAPEPAEPLAPGDKRFNFTLVELLGRGAFGSVFLARQAELADRPVALKISPGTSAEPDRLARLQHANIVPIYSVHADQTHQALCMPYLGRTTLAHVLARLRQQPSTPRSGGELLSTIVVSADPTVVAPTAPPEPAAAPNGGDPARSSSMVKSIHDRLARSSYVDAALWIGSQLAAGLAHAHERGVLHRDLKPANILLADDGRPMLLDFNLADRVRAPAEQVAAVGGTLPYMAPEHLAALETGVGVDQRSDVYSLGVVLYELLTRRLPFAPLAGADARSPRALADQRRRGAPSVRSLNPAVSPAVDSIVARCLAPTPANRYQSADELRTDLDRHLHDLPLKHAPDRSLGERLRKWMRRHPRISSTSTVSAAAVVVIAAMAAIWTARERRAAVVEARAAFQDFMNDAALADAPLTIPSADRETLDEGIRQARRQLDWFPEADDASSDARRALLPIDERRAFDRRRAQTLYLLAGALERRAVMTADVARRDADRRAARSANAAATRIAAHESPAWRAALSRQKARLAAPATEQSPAPPLDAAVPAAGAAATLGALELVAAGRDGDALPALEAWRDAAPHDISAWLLLGNAHAGMANPSEAESCYGFAVARQPKFAFSYFLRGLARLEQHKFRPAASDFTKVLELGGCPTAARINRALALVELRDPAAALADLDAALALPNAPTRAYFVRAQVRRALGDSVGAAADFRRGLAATPTDAASWLARGMAQIARDPDAALADFQQALAVEPTSVSARRNLVHVLADRLGRERDALPHLDAILRADPHDARSLASRAVIRARLGDAAGARADADAVVAQTADPRLTLQAACAYALSAGDDSTLQRQALGLAARALGADPALRKLAASDADLQALRGVPAFDDVLTAAKVLDDHAAPPAGAEDAP